MFFGAVVEVIFSFFYAIVEIFFPELEFIYILLLVFDMGFGKSHGFRKHKAGDKNTKSPSYHKQRYIIPRDKSRKKDEQLSHHHAVRSPQKRARMEAAVDLPCDISSIDAEPFAEPFRVAEPSPVAEPLSTVELMPRELRSAKNNKKKRKNDGKNSPTFILKLYICFFIVILKSLYSETYCTFIYRLFLFSYNFSCQCGAYYFIAS